MSQLVFENESPLREQSSNFCSSCGTKFLLNDTRCQKCNKIRYTKRPIKAPNVQWKKVLYERQPFDDNYLDETFLSSLITQAPPARLTYPQVVLQAMEVSLATSFVSLYLMIFMSMLGSWVDPTVTVVGNILTMLIGLLVSILLSPKIIKLKNIFYILKAGLIVIGSLAILSPVIETFYENYASNTTYAISYGLITIHLIFKDYGHVYSKGASTQIKMDKSTLAIMYLSVILGSRLEKTIEVFTLWLSTLTLFIFSQMFQKSLRIYSVKVYNYTTLAFIIGMAVVIYNVSKIGIIAYLLVNFIIFFIGPLALVWFYQYKNVISGPWDLPDIKAVED